MVQGYSYSYSLARASARTLAFLPACAPQHGLQILCRPIFSWHGKRPLTVDDRAAHNQASPSAAPADLSRQPP